MYPQLRIRIIPENKKFLENLDVGHINQTGPNREQSSWTYQGNMLLEFILIDEVRDKLEEKLKEQLFVIIAWKRYKDDMKDPDFIPVVPPEQAMYKLKQELREANEKNPKTSTKRIDKLPGFQEWLEKKRSR
jgi:hypothetical protein